MFFHSRSYSPLKTKALNQSIFTAWFCINMKNSSLVSFMIGYQEPYYPVADMLQCKGEIIVIIIMSAYGVLGTLFKCFFGFFFFSYYTINSTTALGSRYYYHSHFIEKLKFRKAQGLEPKFRVR